MNVARDAVAVIDCMLFTGEACTIRNLLLLAAEANGRRTPPAPLRRRGESQARRHRDCRWSTWACFRNLLPKHSTGTCCWNSLLESATGICCGRLLPEPDAGTCYLNLLPEPATRICYRNLLPESATGICYRSPRLESMTGVHGRILPPESAT